MFLSTIPTVLVAASLLIPGPRSQPGDGDDPTQNIVELAASTGSFNTLVTAVKAAGLVETLSGEGPFTVFAPTDEAFAQIPEADLKALLADEVALTAVLTYHVVPGKVHAEDVMNLSSVETMNGQSVEFKVWNGKVMVDGATVMSTDIEATNGVIHVIDKVILPEMQ